MYHDKQKLATKLFEIFDNIYVENNEEVEIALDNILDAKQKYSLIMQIIQNLPRTDLENVQRFHKAFKVPKENTHIATDFIYKELRFRLILEECLEMAKALGMSSDKTYSIFLELHKKVKEKNIEPGIKEVLDALMDLLVVVNGTIDVFNLAEVSYEAMEEVTSSNLSKLIKKNLDTLKVIKETKKKMDIAGVNAVVEDLNNGYFAVKSLDTGKILKPTTYIEPNLAYILKSIININ